MQQATKAAAYCVSQLLRHVHMMQSQEGVPLLVWPRYRLDTSAVAGSLQCNGTGTSVCQCLPAWQMWLRSWVTESV